MSDYSDLPEPQDPVVGFHYCPCGTCYVMGVGRMPTRTAVCAGCGKLTAAVPTSPEVRRHAAEVSRTEIRGDE